MTLDLSLGLQILCMTYFLFMVCPFVKFHEIYFSGLLSYHREMTRLMTPDLWP